MQENKTKHQDMPGSKWSQLRKILLRLGFCSLLYTLGTEEGLEKRWREWERKQGGVDGFISEGVSIWTWTQWTGLA